MLDQREGTVGGVGGDGEADDLGGREVDAAAVELGKDVCAQVVWGFGNGEVFVVVSAVSVRGCCCCRCCSSSSYSGE